MVERVKVATRAMANDAADNQATDATTTEPKAQEYQEAWAALFKKLKDKISARFGSRNLPPPHDPNDLENEIIMQVFDSLDRYERQEGKPFWRWVNTIGENTVNDMWRQPKRQRHGGGRVFVPLDDTSGRSLDPTDHDPLTATRLAQSEELREGLLCALAELPAQSAEVIRLRLLEEKEHAAIALALGLRDAAESRLLLHRGLKLVAQRLRQMGLGVTTRRL